MIIQIKILNQETNQELPVNVEEITTVGRLLQKLITEKFIDANKPYYLESLLGNILSPLTAFRDIKERSFRLIQDMPPAPCAFSQLGIFVIDGSLSMRQGSISTGELPVEAVNHALQKTIIRFQQSKKRNCFSFAVIAFGDNAKVILKPESVASINQKLTFTATDYFNNGAGSDTTNISSGLSLAAELVENFFKNKTSGIIHRVVVVILTDGMCHHEQKTRMAASTLKQMPELTICACHLETGANEKEAITLLKDISNNYETVYDEETIRGFFEHSILSKRG